MKEIFRNLFVIMSILTMTVGFVSCSDNDDEAYSIIVGTWGFAEEDYYEKITFQKNGTLILESGEFYNGEWEYETGRGTYRVDGNKLTVDYDDEITTSTIVSITSDTLIIENEGYTFYYYRM